MVGPPSAIIAGGGFIFYLALRGYIPWSRLCPLISLSIALVYIKKVRPIWFGC